MNPAVVIGECMVELSLRRETSAAIGFAGDTFNTAVYLQRLGVRTSYATALGKGDPFSDGILALMADEGVGRDWLVEVEGRLPGLYAIETDAASERRFFYWRDSAPARDYMDLADTGSLQAGMNAAPLVYVSAITLAILGPSGRARLIAMLEAAARSGSPVVLDTNFRPRLWPSAEFARASVEALAPHCRYISASVSDLAGLGLEPDAAARAWASGRAEVVLRRDDNTVEVITSAGRERFGSPALIQVVDTTGAGDAFNAGYLAVRLQGRTPAEAIARARRLAQAVIAQPGAIVPRSTMP
jgi:2-dehydro-3-deoxygluconokinase